MRLGMNYSLIKPNKPRILLKTSMTKILTNRLGSEASARAAFEPEIPTPIPHSRLQKPMIKPPQNNENPV
jgi:hypothetical protein